MISDVAAFLRELVACLKTLATDSEAIAARREALAESHRRSREAARENAINAASQEPITEAHLALCLWEAIGQDKIPACLWRFERPAAPSMGFERRIVLSGAIWWGGIRLRRPGLVGRGARAA